MNKYEFNDRFDFYSEGIREKINKIKPPLLKCVPKWFWWDLNLSVVRWVFKSTLPAVR